MKEKIDEYFKLQKEIHDYFGYVEDWTVFPLEDNRDVYWEIDDDAVYYAENRNDIANLSDKCYSAEIYNYRHLKKYVYYTSDYTMILVDTHCDGNKLLLIFDNTKEVK